MARWWKMACKLLLEEEAATLVEYTLMMILIAASCFAAVSSFGSAISRLLQKPVEALR